MGGFWAWRNTPIAQHVVALMGGSFDPFHLGHQAMVSQALSLPKVQQVWLMPVGVAIHRQLSGQSNAFQRLAWVEKIYENVPRVRVLDWEVQNTHPTSTLETLQRLHQTHPQHMPLLLLGADAFNGLEQWYGYPQHQDLCNICVFPRQGTVIRCLDGWKKASGSWHETAGHVLKMRYELLDISSTHIRAQAKQGLALTEMVNASLVQEIEDCYGGLN
ncbi:MAG: nicotinate (nicotinamide) nucleotide adenylyltransferase [Mariprofundaceae bacterium]|nr:nicotinate (nicotinamide) nucleotide adenylyltransferase [Mariprofundaceae bacterium]